MYEFQKNKINSKFFSKELCDNGVIENKGDGNC